MSSFQPAHPSFDRKNPSRQSARTNKRKTKSLAGNLLGFSAALTVEQIQRVEARGDVYGVNRRVMLAVLTRSGQELLEWARMEDQQDVFLHVIEVTMQYKEHLQTLMDFATATIARMMLAGEAAGE